MATAEEGKKRRSLDSDGAMEHRSKKKKRKDSSARAESHSKSKSSRKRKRAKRKETTPPKIRTLEELAKLVSSGAVRIPKSLLHYVDDRAVLLDQVFTILSPDDVKGMLPDILKGLKTRSVKQLCLEQLKSMTREEVCQTLCPKEESQPDLSFDTVIRELMGKEKGGGEEEDGEPMVRDGKGIETESERHSAAMCGSMSYDSSNCLEKMSTKSLSTTTTSTTTTTTTESPSLFSYKVVHCTKEEEEERGESAMHVSDVSEGSDGCDDDREKALHSVKRARIEDAGGRDTNSSSRGRRHAVAVSNSEQVESDDQLELRVGISDDEIDRELIREEKETEEEEKVEEEKEEGEVEEGEDDSDSDAYAGLEDYWRTAYAEDVPEASRLLEMELRKRALESELKRNSVTDFSPLEEEEAELKSEEPSPVTATEDKPGMIVETVEELVGTAPSQCELENGETELPVTIDTESSLGQSLELELRQKALQSLLAKRRRID